METRPHFKTLFPTILGIMVIGLISTDIYLPSLPAIGKDFSSPNSLVKLTLTLCMLSFSFSQLIYGPLSDRHGRRKIILWGISLSLIGTLICAVSPDIAALIVGRFLQGLGLGVGPAVGRAVFRDVYSGDDLAHYGSYIAVGSATVMAAAPTLGGYIQRYIGWRFNFVFLILFTLLILLMTFYWLNETHKELNPKATKIKTMMKNYFHLLTSPVFMGYTGCTFLAFAGFGAYLAISPFLFQSVIGLSPVEYGWLAFIIAIGLASGGYFNTLFVRKVGRHVMLRIGILLILLSGLFMLLLFIGFINTFVVMFPMLLYIFGSAMVFTNAYAGAFHPFPKMAGSAGALYGSIQILGATISTAIVKGKPMWKTCVFSLGLMSSLVFADGEMDQNQTLIPNLRMASQPQSSKEEVSQNRNQMMGQRQSQSSVEQRLTDLEKIHMHPADFEPTEINGRGVFHAEGEFLYWKFVNDGMPVGLFVAQPNPSLPAGNFNDISPVNVTFDHDPGFRIGGGYTLPYYEWDLNTTWTRLHSKSSVTVAGNGTTSSYLPYWHLIPDLDTSSPTDGRGDMSIDYDAWDLLLGRIFTLYSVFSFNPMIGMQIAWINQKETTVSNGDNAGTPVRVIIDLQNKFKGIGIKAGSDLRMILGWGFEVYGDFFMTLYASTFRLGIREQNFGTTGGNVFSNYKQTLPCTEIDLSVGLKWGTYFYKQAYVSFSVGYEQRNVINFNQLKQLVLVPTGVGFFPVTEINPQPGDLQLRGLTLGGKILF